MIPSQSITILTRGSLSVQIRIRQHSFELSEPFREGHRLSAAEASALNSLRAENIRNNAARELTRAAHGASGPLGPSALAKFTAWVEAYDREYRFAERSVRKAQGGGAAGSAPFDRALRAIATREARVMANRQGRELGEAELEVTVVALMGLSELQAEAAAEVSAAQAIAEEALEDILSEGEERETRASMRASS